MRLLITILLLLLANCFAFSHQDRKFSLRHDNVHVSVWGGEEFSSKAKLKIVGTLAAKLCEYYSSKEPVYIELNYGCTQNCANSYLMSFDNGSIVTYGQTKRIRRSKNVLVIRAVNATFDMPALLNVLEYGLKNTKSIAETQQLCDIQALYQHFSTNTIDTVLLEKVAKSSPSSAVRTALAAKVQVGKTSREESAIQYSFRDDAFHVFTNTSRKPDSALLSLRNPWTFYPLSSRDALIFDTDSSFYYINAGVENPVSRRHILYPISCWGTSCVYAHWENKDLLEFSYTATSSPLGAAHYKMGYYPANDSLVTLRSYRQHH